VTSALTSEGQILGTLQYMSPEQLQGKEADAGSDLYAFGCVFYEMLTGKRAFDGNSAASVIAAIIEREPPSIGTVGPPALDRVVSRCLEKDPEKRWHSAHDLQVALELAMAPAGSAHRAKPYGWTVAGGLAILAAIAFWAPWHQNTAPESTVALHVNPPPGTHFMSAYGGSAISPDGRTIAFVAASAAGQGKLWVRPFDSLSARELSGTEGAENPFWSPDSRSIGYFAGGKLKRVESSGGASTILADAPSQRGGSWGEQGVIVFAPDFTSGLQTVLATGGAPAVLTRLDPVHDANHRWPQFLPGGRKILYLSVGTEARFSGIDMVDISQPQNRKRIIDATFSALYVRPRLHYPGYLLWLRQGSLAAQAFNPDSGQLAGDLMTIPEAQGIGFLSGNYSSGFAVSNNGTLLFDSAGDRYRLTWFGRDGKVIEAMPQLDRYAGVSISPDGARALLAIATAAGNRDLWIVDFARGIQTRLWPGNGATVGIWSPDGKRIVYYRPQGASIFERDTNVAGQQQTLVESTHAVYADDFSPGGELLYEQVEEDGLRALWLLPYPPSRAANRQAALYLKSPATLSNAQFSPDGRWVAYSSNAGGRPEIYIQSFPKGEIRRIQISNNGGDFPRWTRTGKELFYRAADGNLMAAAIRETARGVEPAAPALQGIRIPASGGRYFSYDISPDGQRILALAPDTSENTPLTILMNWQASLKP
jgi:Tol biopolymer transport system component